MAISRMIGRKEFSVALASALVLLAAALACAPRPVARPPQVSVGELIDQGTREGLKLENPFELDPEIDAIIEKEIGYVDTPIERIRRITRFLNDRGYINFKYQPDDSLTAREAFHQRKGDCMAYTNLFLGIARHLNLPVYFVHVSEARNYYEKDGLFFRSSHMAVGYVAGQLGDSATSPYVVVVDFTEEATGTGLMLYEAIDDAKAFALYYNNVAVDAMLKGDMAYSEKLLKFLLKGQPGLKEVTNNLGVLYMREGRYEDALVVLQEGMKGFPSYQPFYTNAVQAARGCGQFALAADLEAKGQELTRRDPFFLFNSGVHFFQSKDYAGAVRQFNAALRVQSKNPNQHVLQAWLARAHLAAGQTEAGIEAFKKAQAASPNYNMLTMLRHEYPVLQSVPEPQMP